MCFGLTYRPSLTMSAPLVTIARDCCHPGPSQDVPFVEVTAWLDSWRPSAGERPQTAHRDGNDCRPGKVFVRSLVYIDRVMAERSQWPQPLKFRGTEKRSTVNSAEVAFGASTSPARVQERRMRRVPSVCVSQEATPRELYVKTVIFVLSNELHCHPVTKTRQ
ncbi:hypothetical protein RRG08_008230 [Elysia crispata]|uniref:Uncharacterized protein n=1 Tax=Elysia crispata TaxID=231223 RepID=A0AAE1CWE4_9GAST|nr:hypothetical protein RRG08_008230 [Elysia crispata]